jgi:hypothetical protein
MHKCSWKKRFLIYLIRIDIHIMYAQIHITAPTAVCDCYIGSVCLRVLHGPHTKDSLRGRHSYAYVCIHTYKYIHLYVYVYIYIIYIHMYIYIYIYINMCIYTHIFIYSYIHIYIHICLPCILWQQAEIRSASGCAHNRKGWSLRKYDTHTVYINSHTYICMHKYIDACIWIYRYIYIYICIVSYIYIYI